MKLKKFNFKKINSTNDTAIRIIKSTNNRSGIVITKIKKKAKDSMEENGLLIMVICL